jgi:tRNA-dihydrouridine synthase B
LTVAINNPIAAAPAKPFSIDGVVISPPVVLAPMADVTNGAYRRLVKRIGSPGLVVTELISTMALHYKSARTISMFDITPDQHPVSVQIFGSDPEIMAEAARFAEGEGADIIDINMGCWVPKVCKTGGGAAMMKDEATACRAVEAIATAVKLPVTVKTRAGWDYGQFATVGFAKQLTAAGARCIALHARYAVQGHTGDADWDLIRQVKQAVDCPVIGNGDVKTPEEALRMLRETGCDGVMIGRAAIGNPWAVRDVVAAVTGKAVPAPPTLQERGAAALQHVTDLADHIGEEMAVRSLRSQLPLYVKGYPGASFLRDRIVQAIKIKEVEELFALHLEYAENFLARGLAASAEAAVTNPF